LPRRRVLGAEDEESDNKNLPGGLLTTAQVIEYLKPVAGSICDPRWLGSLDLVTGLSQKAKVI
jgi:hypothetical protein